MSIVFDEEEFTEEIGQGNANGLVVSEHMIVGSGEREVVVKIGDFHKVKMCWKSNDSMVAESTASFFEALSLYKVVSVGDINKILKRI